MQTATGSTFLINYSSYFFLVAGESHPFVDSIITTCAGLIGVLVSFFLVRVLARRTILMFGSFAQSKNLLHNCNANLRFVHVCHWSCLYSLAKLSRRRKMSYCLRIHL